MYFFPPTPGHPGPSSNFLATLIPYGPPAWPPGHLDHLLLTPGHPWPPGSYLATPGSHQLPPGDPNDPRPPPSNSWCPLATGQPPGSHLVTLGPLHPTPGTAWHCLAPLTTSSQ